MPHKWGRLFTSLSLMSTARRRTANLFLSYALQVINIFMYFYRVYLQTDGQPYSLATLALAAT